MILKINKKKDLINFVYINNKIIVFEKLFIKSFKNNFFYLYVLNGFICYILSLKFINLDLIIIVY